MQKDYRNKQITDAANKAEEASEEFFFVGGGEYKPLTVKARTREEAEQEWEARREKVEPTQIINK